MERRGIGRTPRHFCIRYPTSVILFRAFPCEAKSSGKIGKIEAENDYYNKVVPAVKSRPDLFLPEHLDRWYTLERYHIIGSRILSRSFQVERWDPSEDDGTPQMDVDGGAQNPSEQAEEHSDDVGEEDNGDSDDEDNEDADDVAMVPMADMLNARYGCNNV